MMSRIHKVSIFTDVSQEVFDGVVSPAKAEKRFGRLVSSLLEAYYSNEKVRFIVDGNQEMEHVEGLLSLKEQLDRASKSATNLGIISDSIQDTLDYAKEDFSSIAGGEVKAEPKSEFEEFRKEMLETQKLFMEDIKSMLQSVVASGQTNQTIVSTKEEVPPVVSSPVVEEEQPMFEAFEVIKEEPTQPKGFDGSDVLKSLIGDKNSFEFGGM